MNFRILFIFLLLICKSAISQEKFIIKEDEILHPEKFIYIYEDKSGKLSIDQIVRNETPVKFEKPKQDVPVFSPDFSTYWIKLLLINTTRSDYYLDIINPTIDYCNVYLVNENQVVYQHFTGDQFPYSTRQIKTNNFTFKLPISNYPTTTLYLKISGTEGLEIPIKLMSAEQAIKSASHRNFWGGIYYGILLVTILYNLFLFFSIKDISYLYYILYVLTFGIVQSGILGYMQQFIVTDSPYLANQLIYIFSCISGLFVILFVRNFLQTKIRLPKLHKFEYFIALSYLFVLAFSILSLFNSDLFSFYNQFAITIAVISISIYCLVAAIIVYLQNYQPARFFLIAWMLFLTGLVIYILKTMAIVPYNFFTNHTIQIGSAIEAILLSLALGDRYSILKKENEENIKQVILTLKDNEKIKDELNKELQEKIKARIKSQEELSANNQSLMKINKDLDNFIYTASHDLKAPILNIEGLINTLKYYPSCKDEPVKKLIDLMDLSINRFKRTITDLGEITKIQKPNDQNKDLVNLEEITKEVQLSINNLFEDSNARIVSDYSECGHLRYSKKNIRSILYNLISNAIKYKSPLRSPLIQIKTYLTDDYIILSIKDNGLGIEPEKLDKIFGMFNRAHDHVEGSGIGLYIVKRIIENEGGKIKVESIPGTGSDFKVFFKRLNGSPI